MGYDYDTVATFHIPLFCGIWPKCLKKRRESVSESKTALDTHTEFMISTIAWGNNSLVVATKN